MMAMSLARWLEHLRAMLALALGRMRGTVLVLRGARMGPKVFVGPGCIIQRAYTVTCGERVLLEAEVYLKSVADSARITIGSHTFLGKGVELDVKEQVLIGRHSLIAPGCFITDHGHGLDPSLRIDQQEVKPAPVHIGSDVWLGFGVVVLPGVSIGDGAVVGANSVVTEDVAPMTIVAGSPARPIRKRGEPRQSRAG